MALGIGILDTGLGYLQQGLDWVRNLLTTIAGWLPLDAELSVTILFLLVSLWAGHFITKKFVIHPLSGSYIFWTLIISLSIFLNLMYL